jgi:hypothetical protein
LVQSMTQALHALEVDLAAGDALETVAFARG